MNFKDLNRILRSKIFLHKDEQLRAAHVIHGYTPSTNCFQSPKNVIRAKDPCLAIIDVAIPGFLLTEPPLEGTQDAQLPARLAARLIYSQEPPIPSNDESGESSSESIQEVTDKDFEVFYCPDAPGKSQPYTSINMGFEEKTPNLLALLTAHAGDFSPAVVVVPRPPTPTATHTSPIDAKDKKRKKAHGDKDAKGTKEGEIT